MAKAVATARKVLSSNLFAVSEPADAASILAVKLVAIPSIWKVCKRSFAGTNASNEGELTFRDD
jgi:hypothetical protein